MPETAPPMQTVVSQNQPAAHRRAVYLCSDQNYLPATLFLANQIATAHPMRDFDICILSATPIAHHPLFDELALRVVQIDTGAMEQQVHVSGRIVYAAYLRIFMPSIWINDYDQLLYLDGDIFYQRGDISALLKQSLDGLPLAAVTDFWNFGRLNMMRRDLRKLKLPRQPYFNSGVLLIHVKTFVDQGYSDAVIRLLVTRGHDLRCHDQTALNVVMAHKWAVLPVQWNYQYHMTSMLWSAHIDVCLYHFAASRKPFVAKYGAHARRFTTPYRQFFAVHFPHLVAQLNDGLGGPKKWRSQLFVVLLNLGRMRGLMALEQLTDGDFDIRPIAAQHLRE